MKTKGGIDISNNVGITSYLDVMDICKPLYDFLDITYFNYVKLHRDGSRSVLTDRTDFIIDYYADPTLFNTKAVIDMEDLNENQIFLSCEFRNQKSYITAREHFDIDNGFTIIQPRENHIDLYYFGTHKNNYNHTELYKSNLDLFYRFIIYFNERAADLIKHADRQRFALPGHQSNQSSLKADIKRLRESFIEATRLQKLSASSHQALPTFLTSREAEILAYIAEGKTSKQIAQKLFISHRTVETHFANAKEKLGYSKKSELLKHLSSTPLGEKIRYCFMS